MLESDLSGRCALITGGLTGQGLAVARTLSSRGAAIAAGSLVCEDKPDRRDAAHYPDPEEVEAARDILNSGNAPVHVGNLDVRCQASIDGFVKAAAGLTGGIDILVNAAGTTAEQPVIGHDDALWELIIGVNLGGAFRMTRSCLPGMVERGWGRIVNLGSTAATTGWKDNPAYCSSKSGLLGLTRCVALEGAPHGVTCNMISPTWVETGLMRRNVAQVAKRDSRDIAAGALADEIARSNPQGRHIQPGEIAALALYLCSDQAAGITGENIGVTGGSTW